ncbi:hypothetical protein HUW51_20220 [Adhaeribacter swui]|uniref:Lipoprotein n=1 Tax=Adhaeribacter swui TaxID=2086471 RepID=A0A7G7GCP9_9BACT|nr:hypothetical protein [Adhaeribacter swui]QNF34933.1 hypothetical protein HUW51_20220 [Adhaeribacter swui]
MNRKFLQYGFLLLLLSYSSCKNNKESTSFTFQVQAKNPSLETPAEPSKPTLTPVKDKQTAAILPDTIKKITNDSTIKASKRLPSANKNLKTTVVGPDTLPGSILPAKRIVAFYGTPLSKRMGILGELPPTEMLDKLDLEVSKWQQADPKTPVQPALHLIAVTAQNEPGRSGKYRLRVANSVIDSVLHYAQTRNALVFLDIQLGTSTLQEELPVLENYLKLPNVHLGIDAEFALKPGKIPGRNIGTYDAEDINFASQYLADIARQNQLPPKLLIVHRFTKPMITNYKKINLDPYCQIVMHMDGWGNPAIKKSSYLKYIKEEPVQYAGIKIFYRNDIRKKGWRLMKPHEILALNPKPYYIQYQ